MPDTKDSRDSTIFADLPIIFVSRTHFTEKELGDFEEALEQAGARLTYNVLEAGILLSKVTKKTRLLFDLRAKGVTIDELQNNDVLNDLGTSASPPRPGIDHDVTQERAQPVVIEIKDDDSTASDGETGTATIAQALDADIQSTTTRLTTFENRAAPTLSASDTVIVLRVEWFEQSVKAGHALPYDDFKILSGHCRPVEQPSNTSQTDVFAVPSGKDDATPFAKASDHDIIERAREDAGTSSVHPARSMKRKFQGLAAPPGRMNPSWAAGHSAVRHAHLLHATTSEEDQGFSSDLPEPPEWVVKGIKYACQRCTLAGSPNESFIELLRKIKLARLLTSDEIGVRAYSTSIAALLAYDHKFTSPREVLRLPGCDAKIANLFVEWANTGSIKAVEDIEQDHDLTILRLFYNIWGVGSLTAREFYFDRGWQDLDDLVEYNWKGLSRVQQIGVKYYEEFLDPIPRAEVERIGEIIHRHAVQARDGNIQSMIVGGYRRGKKASGDVDIIVSHPDEEQTLSIITDIVASLEDEGWITHTLLLSTNNTKRDQQTLPFRSGDMHGGHGFDSLDKALVVWQDPDWPSKERDLANDPKAKNQNVHRRVDIIIAPWRTAGCAVLGWSGGTTFQRDIRRYVRHSFGWKFDSSGVRDRGNGDVIDLEGWNRYTGKLGTGRAKTMFEAEKRVFEGLELEYREAWERCTD